MIIFSSRSSAKGLADKATGQTKPALNPFIITKLTCKYRHCTLSIKTLGRFDITLLHTKFEP